MARPCFLCYVIGRKTMGTWFESLYPNKSVRNEKVRSVFHICLAFHRIYGPCIDTKSYCRLLDILESFDKRLVEERGASFFHDVFCFVVSRFSWVPSKDLYIREVLNEARNVVAKLTDTQPMTLAQDLDKKELDAHLPIMHLNNGLCMRGKNIRAERGTIH